MKRSERLRTPLAVLIAATIVLLLCMGIRAAFAVFLKPMSLDLGWGRELFALAIAAQNLIWGLTQPFVGALADRYGSARIVTIFGAIYALGLLATAYSTTSVEFVVSAGLVVGLAMSGTGYAVMISLVARTAPPARRGLYVGLASAGGSSGQVLMVPLGQGLIDASGWFTAMLAFAALTLVMIPLAYAFGGIRGDTGSEPATAPASLRAAIAEAAGHRGFWLLCLGFFVCGFHVTFIGTHLPAYVTDIGLSPTLGAVTLAMIGFGNIFGSLGWSLLGERYRKKRVLSTLYLLRALWIYAFIHVPQTEASLLAFAFVIGLLWLGTTPVTTALVAQIFGMRYLTTLFGLVFLCHQVGSFFGAWYGGRAFDQTGSYDAVWWLGIGLALFAAVVHWPIRDEPIARTAAQPA